MVQRETLDIRGSWACSVAVCVMSACNPASPHRGVETSPVPAETVAAPDPEFVFSAITEDEACGEGGMTSCFVDAQVGGSSIRFSFDPEGRLEREDWATPRFALVREYGDDGQLSRLGLDREADGSFERVRRWVGEDSDRRMVERTVEGEAAPPPWAFRACIGDEARDWRECTRLTVSWFGNRFGVSIVRYDAQGRETERILDTFGRHRMTQFWRRTHDDEGRLVREENGTTRYTRRRDLSYDEEGRCVREDVGTVGHRFAASLHRYDEAGRRTVTVDEEGEALITRRYDEQGRLVREERDVGEGSSRPPDGEVSEVVVRDYDAATRERSWDDGIHREVEHFDARGRLVRLEFLEGDGPPRRTETHGYDPTGCEVSVVRNALGADESRHERRCDRFGALIVNEQTAPDGSFSCSVHGRDCAQYPMGGSSSSTGAAQICERACAFLFTYAPGAAGVH